MKFRILIAIVLAFMVASTASADTDRLERLADKIASEAVVRAHALARAPAAPAFAPPSGDPLLSDMQDFALAAITLSNAIEANEGPQDLRCIFRGMGRDIETRITALMESETRADQSRAYREIERLARQAERIAANPDAQVASTPRCELPD